MKIPDRLFENIVVALVLFSTILFFMLGFGVVKLEGGFDLKRNLNETIVYIEEDGEREDCVWNAERRLWSCSEMEWNTVGRTNVNVDGKPVQCIWAHARQDKAIHLEYPKTIEGSELNVKAMLADSAIGCIDDTPVRLEVIVNGRTEATVEVSKNKSTETEKIKLTEKQNKIGFQITTENQTCKHYCFDANIN